MVGETCVRAMLLLIFTWYYKTIPSGSTFFVDAWTAATTAHRKTTAYSRQQRARRLFLAQHESNGEDWYYYQDEEDSTPQPQQQQFKSPQRRDPREHADTPMSNRKQEMYPMIDDGYSAASDLAPRLIQDDEFNQDDSLEYYYEDDSYYEDDYDLFNDRQPGSDRSPAKEGQRQGNFWSNPTGTVEDLRLNNEPRRSRRRPRRATTFRSGTPKAPPPVSDLYNRLFWYGMDPSESTSPADQTMFGGTKGKFNGLSYVNPDEARIKRPKRRTPRQPRPGRNGHVVARDERNSEMDFYSEVTPPYDSPRPKRKPRPSRPRERSRRSYDDYDYGGDYDQVGVGGDWASQVVSNWFGPDDDAEPQEDDNRNGRRERRRKRQRKDDQFPGWNVLDTFLGLDRQSLDEKARDYNQAMGIGRHDTEQRVRRPQRRRRKGYGDPIPRVDIGNVEVDYSDARTESPPARIIDTEIQDEVQEQEPSNKIEPIESAALSWEDRALAIQRVPPAGIPAWGPSGDMGVDARTQAISDAMEDVALANRKVEACERREARLRDDLTIFRVDAEMERKTLASSGALSAEELEEAMRGLELQVEDTSRSLRLACMKVQKAKEELTQLKGRHWAVLSFYDADLAQQEVEVALKELEEAEPAVRRVIAKSETVVEGEEIAQ